MAAFPDDFTGSNGSGWNSSNWDAAPAGTSTIQSNTGQNAVASSFSYGQVRSKSGGPIDKADFDWAFSLTPQAWGGSQDNAITIMAREDGFTSNWIGLQIDTTATDSGALESPGTGAITAGRVRLMTVTGNTIATTHGTGQIDVSTTPTTIYVHMTFSGSSISATVWRDGQTEAGGITLSGTDSLYTANTRWGFRYSSGSQSAQYWQIDSYTAPTLDVPLLDPPLPPYSSSIYRR